MVLLALALTVLLVGIPVLAILALVRVRALEQKVSSFPLQQLIARIYALEQRLSAQGAAGTPAAAPSAPATPAQPPQSEFPAIPVVPPQPAAFQAPATATPLPSPPAPEAAPPLFIPEAKGGAPLDVETLIAGRWFNRIGIVALLVAISYFLKLAFDNNWIGPSGRVAIGVLLGALMLPWSQWLLGRGYAYFSEGIAGLGEATLYLSVWAGCQYYSLFSRDVGFAGMILITGAMAAVAIGRNSQRIALLSLLGGFSTPLLVSTGKDEQVVLFTYLLILGAGLLAIGARRAWITLAPLSFILTQVYFWGWYAKFYQRSEPLERTVVFASLFFLLYAALPVLRALRSPLGGLDIFLHLLNAFAYLAALYILLWPANRWPLTLLVVALACAHLVVARMMPAGAGKASLARLLFAGLALTFATLAVPIRLDGKWITLAFAVEGAVLVWSGLRASSYFLRQSGHLLMAIAALRLIFLPPPAEQFLLNQRFAAYLVMIACFVAALTAARGYASSLGEWERAEGGILAVGINVYAVIALSLELWDFFARAATPLDASLAQHLSLSVLWTVYASALILLGVQRRSALLRWQALILFGVVVVKVFLYDLSFLERVYRILSFLILGSVLLVVSFLYQRKIAREKSAS